MARKSVKIDDLIEALCEEKVIATLTNKLQENLTQSINSKIEQLISGLVADIKDSILDATNKLITEKVKSSTLELTSQMIKYEDRINVLENKLLQHELVIYGMDSIVEDDKNEATIDATNVKNNLLIMQVTKVIQDCLNIKVEPNEINFVYKQKKTNKGSSPNPSPVVLNLISTNVRNEIIQKARHMRKTKLISAWKTKEIYFNERLTTRNSELAFLARTMVKEHKLASTWTFRGEVYVKNESTAKAHRILSTNDLKEYGAIN